MQLATDGSGAVLDTRMPLYPSSSSNPTALNPCPPDWGNGQQGSTNYSYFAWANATVGYKWGKALPAWCMDEAWPGVYPLDEALYGQLSGQAVLPGCEPASCKPLYTVAAGAGSIHLQVLPYVQDAWNATGGACGLDWVTRSGRCIMLQRCCYLLGVVLLQPCLASR
jgi:hypothetical protein